MTTRILLLAGTAEARALAGRLWDMPRLDVVASLAGVTESAPTLPAGETRVGGFGGPAGLRRYLEAQRIDLVIDATHPFAATMPWNAARACREAEIDRLRLIRPPWPIRRGWVEVETLDDAARNLPPGARVFLTTGRSTIALFAARRDLRIVARSIDCPGEVPGHVVPVRARPPFSYASEFALMCSHRIDHLVTKNSGGKGTAKLDAAEALGVTTIVVARPPQPPGETAASVPEAIRWLREKAGLGN